MGKAANKGGNDCVYTPVALCKAIVNHYNSQGSIIEPCEGSGNFLSVFKEHQGITKVTACELQHGEDYLAKAYEDNNWLIANPPFSKLHLFLRKAMQDNTENIVFLCYANTFLMNGKMKSLNEFGYSIKEIAFVTSPHYHIDNKSFCTEEQWPQSGFALAATLITKSNESNPVSSLLKTSFLDW